MKKCLISILLLACLSMLFVSPVFAEAEGHLYTDDIEDFLTDEQLEELDSKAQSVSEQYDSGVYIIVTSDFTEYGYDDINEFAEDMYTNLEMGRRDDQDGIVLVLSMADRDYSLTAHGEFANYCYTDYAKEEMEQYFLDDFKNDDWYQGLDDYISQCGRMLEAGSNGTPVDVEYVEEEKSPVKAVASGGLVGVIAAAFVSLLKVLGLKKELKTTGVAHTAYEYVYDGGVMLRKSRDIFLHRDVVRVPIEHNNHSGGHGGTTVNSGGFSHSSGKF